MTKDNAARVRAALLDPAAVFGSPEEVERDPTLSRDEKLAVLESWEEDARELAVAEEENMGGGEPSRLDDVVAARVRLAGGEQDTPAHRQGGAGADRGRTRVRRFARPVREIVHADHEIDEAALRLSLQEHPVVPVADADQIVGVIARAELARAGDAKETAGNAPITARVMMTTDLAFCYLDDDVGAAHALMDKHGCSHLMVVDRDRVLVGTLERGHLPPVSDAEIHALEERPDVTDPREEQAQGVARHIQPGGLGVYAERAKLSPPRD